MKPIPKSRRRSRRPASPRPMRSRRRGRQRSGQALVEMSFVLPVFLLLVFGIIDFGRAIYTLNYISNASRTGARILSLPNQRLRDCDAIKAAIANAPTLDLSFDPKSKFGNLDPTPLAGQPPDLTAFTTPTLASTHRGYVYVWPAMNTSDDPTNATACTISPDNPNVGIGGRFPNTPVKVRVTYAFAPITPLINKIVPSITLSAESDGTTEHD